MRQLALPFLHRSSFAAADFMPAPANEAALAYLASDDWPLGRLALHGPAGTGKTHLLHLWLARGIAAGRDAALLEASAVRTLPPDAPLPATGALAVDDADTIVTQGGGAEEPLLHLLNRAAEAGIPLLLASRTAPARWNVALPDLASRLRATPAVAIGDPDDALLDALFGRLLADRQLAAGEGVARFLRARLPRDAASLRAAVAALDRMALERGRPVSLAIAQAFLAVEEEGQGSALDPPRDSRPLDP